MVGSFIHIVCIQRIVEVDIEKGNTAPIGYYLEYYIEWNAQTGVHIVISL